MTNTVQLTKKKILTNITAFILTIKLEPELNEITDIYFNFFSVETAVGCRTDAECPAKEGCVNGRCQVVDIPKEPVVGECPPCNANEECDATTLTCFPGKFQIQLHEHANKLLTISMIIVNVFAHFETLIRFQSLSLYTDGSFKN